MMDIPPALLQGVGVVGVVLIIFWMLSTGRLVTKNVVDDIRSQRDDWKRLYEEQRRINTDTLIPLAEFTAHAFGSVASAAHANGEKGDRGLPTEESR